MRAAHREGKLKQRRYWLDLSLCAAWLLLTFAVYFHFAGRIQTLGWSAIEFIIANHLRDFGAYATGYYYPPAIWRPVLGTFAVYAVDSLVSDPLLTFQILSGLALSIFVASIYLANRILWGVVVANFGAFLAFTSPAVSVGLLNHIHSISHICLLAVLGPTMGLSVYLLTKLADDPRVPHRVCLLLAGLAWGLCYLARRELMLGAGIFLVFLAITLARSKRWMDLVLPIAGFLVFFLPYTVWFESAAAQYDLLQGKLIYQFYNSQGWSDPRPSEQDRDVERAGYIYAVELYGTPTENSESVLTAISRNPDAFAARVRKNRDTLLRLLASGEFFPSYLTFLLIISPLSLLFLRGSTRLIYLYLAASASIVAFFLCLHIDPRYLVVGVPFAILLACFPIAVVVGLPRPWSAITSAASLAFLGIHLAAWLSALPASFSSQRFDPSRMQHLARYFIDITKPSPDERARMYVLLNVPGENRWENRFLFYYYSRVALVQGNAEGLYPRGRIFSFKDCPPTHGVYPLGSGPAVVKDMSSRVVGQFTVDAKVFEVREFLKDGKPSRGCGPEAGPQADKG